MNTVKYKKQALAFVTALTVAGCNGTDVAKPGKTLKSREEAGTVLVSVNSIAPWDQVSAALQPTFTMASGDDALDKVAPRTQRLVEQTLQAFGFSLGLGLPQTSTNATQTTGLQQSSTVARAGDETTRNSESNRTLDNSSTTTLQPGQAPEVPEGLPAGAGRLTAKSADGDIGLDPFLQYQAAAALYQEVQLLNREVNIAASRRCYAPYLVRLQLAAIPYRQNVAYDIHTKIGFFHGAGDTPPVLEIGELEDLTDQQKKQMTKQEQAMWENERKQEKFKRQQGCLNATTPYVVPILATDNLERAVHSRASELARQIGLGVNFMVQGIGGNVGLNAANQQLRAVLADDVNSLFTVSRLTDNSLYVRIGASQQAAVRAALVGRTYDVSLLLLVPLGFFEEPQPLITAFDGSSSKTKTPMAQGSNPEDQATRRFPRISMITRNDYRKADKGQPLADPTMRQTVARYETALAAWLRSPGMQDAWDNADDLGKLCHIQELRRSVYPNNYRAFQSALEKTSCVVNFTTVAAEEGQAKALWLAIAQADADSPHKTASFELPVSPDLTIKKQTVLLREQNGKQVNAVLREASGITAGDLAAWLAPSANELDKGFVAEKVTVNPDANTVSLTFPSLSALGLKKTEVENRQLFVQQRDCPVPVWPVCRKSKISGPFAVRYVKVPKEAPKPSLSLSSPQSEIVLRENVPPTVKLHIEKLQDEEAVVSVKGAFIDAASLETSPPVALPVVRDKVTVGKATAAKGATIRLSLGNIRAGSNVTVTATGMKTVSGKKVATGKASLNLKVVKAN